MVSDFMTTPRYWTLDGIDPIKLTMAELIKANGMSDHHNRVAFDLLPTGSEVSTVLLMWGHYPCKSAVFETAVFDKEGNCNVFGRTDSFKEALECHDKAVEANGGRGIEHTD